MAWTRTHKVRVLGLNGMKNTKVICCTDTVFFSCSGVLVLRHRLMLSQVAVIWGKTPVLMSLGSQYDRIHWLTLWGRWVFPRRADVKFSRCNSGLESMSQKQILVVSGRSLAHGYSSTKRIILFTWCWEILQNTLRYVGVSRQPVRHIYLGRIMYEKWEHKKVRWGHGWIFIQPWE